MPVTGKLTIVLEDSLADAGAYGVAKGKNFRPETGFGAEASLITDVRWDFTLRFKVNEYVSGFFSSNLIYDKDIIDKIQFRYSINIGFSYDLKI